jgi:hypothetical protein
MMSGKNIPYGGSGRTQNTFGDAYGAFPTITMPNFSDTNVQIGILIGAVLATAAILLYGKYAA